MKIVKTFEGFTRDYWDLAQQETEEKERVATKYTNAKTAALSKYKSIIDDCADDLIDEYDADVDIMESSDLSFRISFDITDVYKCEEISTRQNYKDKERNIISRGFSANHTTLHKLKRELNTLNLKLKTEFDSISVNVLNERGHILFRSVSIDTLSFILNDFDKSVAYVPANNILRISIWIS